jgi:hypothetical protein
LAEALPMPRAAPVTMATFPERSVMTSSAWNFIR